MYSTFNFKIPARDSLFACLPGDDLLSQELALQVSLALERKADEPFATLRPVTQTPAVWILNFRVQYYEHRKATSLEIAFSLVYLAMTYFPRSLRSKHTPECGFLTSVFEYTKGGRAFRHTASTQLQQCGSLTSVFGIRKADELFATLRPITHTPAVWIERVEPRPQITVLLNTEKTTS